MFITLTVSPKDTVTQFLIGYKLSVGNYFIGVIIILFFTIFSGNADGRKFYTMLTMWDQRYGFN